MLFHALLEKGFLFQFRVELFSTVHREVKKVTKNRTFFQSLISPRIIVRGRIGCLLKALYLSFHMQTS